MNAATKPVLLKQIRKTIRINAPKEKVWDVLLQDGYTRNWYAAFSEGAHAITDWQQGSKAIFTDGSGSGIIGTVETNKPAEALVLTYSGILANGAEDYSSGAAQGVKGTQEKYILTEQHGQTQLDVSCDLAEAYFDSMSAAWDRALQKVKALAEGN